MRDRERVYLEIWRRIEKCYFGGYLFNERTLQAELYKELRNTLPDVHVIAEPGWTVGSDTKYPDLVIVEEDQVGKDQITDIFELKFKPEPDGDVSFEDIQKLLQYGVKEKCYLVELNPDWGRRIYDYPVRDACRLHFVVVANRKRDAVWPAFVRREVRDLKEKNPELNENPRVLSHWFGQVEGYTDENEEKPTTLWDIEFGI